MGKSTFASVDSKPGFLGGGLFFCFFFRGYEQLDPGKEVAKSEEVEPKVSIADMHSKILAQHKLAFGQKF